MFSISIFSESGRVLLVLLPYILWVCGLGRVRVNQVSGLYTCDLPKLGAANRKGSWGSRGISFGCETQCSKNFQKRQDILIRFTSTAQGGGGSFKYRTLWESRWVVVMHGWQSRANPLIDQKAFGVVLFWNGCNGCRGHLTHNCWM